ncbi:MAG: hypothetical protein HYY40_08060 [Bacteroidetes bacterium]|nr:hypothetical protein [Bacteroidota bacterium]
MLNSNKITYFFFIAGLLPLTALYAFSQEKKDTIEVKKSFGGTVFRMDGKNLRPVKLFEIVPINSEAAKEKNIAETNYYISMCLGLAGGFLIGYPLGISIRGGEAPWGLAGIGAGLAVISIPFTSTYTKHATRAVRIYNRYVNEEQ